MPQTDTATLRRVYDAFARGDFRSTVDVYDPNVVFVHCLGSETDVWGSELTGTYYGLEGIGDYMRRLLDLWSEVAIEAEELQAVGDSILATVVMRVRGKVGGVPGDLRFFHLWTFRGGKAIRLDVMPEREQAFEALGLAEDPRSWGQRARPNADA